VVEAVLPALTTNLAETGVLALAFCLSHPHLATALVGVSRCEDLAENLAALDLLGRADEIRAAVTPLAIEGVGHPKLFNPHNDI
jgi:aryl-alcohol dehydrogenase-like predicted oxidoreductase